MSELGFYEKYVMLMGNLRDKPDKATPYKIDYLRKAILAIVINEIGARKGDINNRKQDLKISYIEKTLSELYGLKKKNTDLSLVIDKWSRERDSEKQVDRLNDIIYTTSELNITMYAVFESYDKILKSFDCDIELIELKNSMADFFDRITERCIKGPVMSESDINTWIENAQIRLDSKIDFLIMKLKELYRNKK